MSFCSKCGGIMGGNKCRECGAVGSGAESLIKQTEEEFYREGPLVIERESPRRSANNSGSANSSFSSPPPRAASSSSLSAPKTSPTKVAVSSSPPPRAASSTSIGAPKIATSNSPSKTAQTTSPRSQGVVSSPVAAPEGKIPKPENVVILKDGRTKNNFRNGPMKNLDSPTTKFCAKCGDMLPCGKCQ